MKIFFLLISIGISTLSFAQIRIQRIQEENLPKEVQLPFINQAVRWVDSLGTHYIVVTKKPNIYSSFSVPLGRYTNGFVNVPYRISKQDISAYTHHFIVLNDTPRLQWREYGRTIPCSKASPGNMVKNKFELTDLDKDGKLEIWLINKAVCPDDTAASGITILLYNKSNLAILQGDNGKTYKANEWGDWSFRMLSQIFKDYAMNLWRRTQYSD